MPRYAALLRGVSPMNAKMSELWAAFEAAGFDGVRTVLSSGNVVFGARSTSVRSVQRRAEAAMAERLGSTFLTIVRSVEDLRTLLGSDPWQAFRLRPGSKRIVTFLREPPATVPKLPISLGDARILAVRGREIFTTFVPDPNGPDFMTLIERTFGKELTTRTWETVTKVAR